MKRIKFQSIIKSFDTYNSLFKTGIVVSPKQKDNKWCYIIGLDISYDTINFLDYHKFTIVELTEQQISFVYVALFGENKYKLKQEQKVSIHNLLHEILLSTEHYNRALLLTNYFNIKTIKQYSVDNICKIIDFQIQDNGYRHIDINTGLRFVGEETYDINGNIIE